MMIGQIPCFAFVAVVLSNAALAGSHVPDLGPAPVFSPVDPDAAELGQLLFYDPILSGNRTVSCASCHHPRFGTGDGVSLSLGDGGRALARKGRPTLTTCPNSAFREMRRRCGTLGQRAWM